MKKASFILTVLITLALSACVQILLSYLAKSMYYKTN